MQQNQQTPLHDAKASALSAKIHQAVVRAATDVRSSCAQVELDRLTVDRIVRIFSKVLFPRGPGRPQRADVTEAFNLVLQGVPKREIYRRLGKNTPTEQRALCEAIRQRRLQMKRLAREKRSLDLSSQENS